jgi:diguanylate cyclase (GGDEF)-like protein
MNGLLDNQPVVGFRNRFRAKDGSYRWLVWSWTPHESRRLMYASVRDETERVRFESELERLSYRDSLTGLANRRAFLEQLASALAAAKRYRQSFSILYVDLDNFKALNDSRGHQAGDKALQEIAGGLTGALRESDFVARLGGDEFAVLLPPVADSHDNVIVAQRIRTTVSEICLQLVSASGCWDFGASIGVAVYPGDGATADELMQAADRAMYRVKNAVELLV